jgi:hypothetical protein
MRLFEVEDRFTDDLITIVRNLVGRSNEKRAPGKLTYPALSSMLVNLGYGSMTYEEFRKAYESSEELKQLIQNYTEDGITLKTNIMSASDEEETGRPSGPDVGKMASSAAKDWQQDLT